MGGIHNRTFVCKHCGNSYRPKRSDQQFCSTSHRAANFQLVKRQQSPKSAVPVSTLSAVPDMPIAKPTSVSLYNPLVYIGSSFLANVLDHAGQKAAGVHNHDLKKSINIIAKNQETIFNLIKSLDSRNQAILKHQLDKENPDNI